jgi:hypothetical protein
LFFFISWPFIIIMVDTSRISKPSPAFQSGKNENAIPTNLITYKGELKDHPTLPRCRGRVYLCPEAVKQVADHRSQGEGFPLALTQMR